MHLGPTFLLMSPICEYEPMQRILRDANVMDTPGSKVPYQPPTMQQHGIVRDTQRGQMKNDVTATIGGTINCVVELADALRAQRQVKRVCGRRLLYLLFIRLADRA
jgi:hypothetical protein